MKDKPIVLIVEDHAGVRDVLERAVEAWADVDILSCDGFDGAVSWMQKAPHIDLLICDVFLPNQRSGIELAELMKGVHPEIAVVVTSADPKEVIVGFNEQYGFIQKPYGRDDFISVITDAHSRQRTGSAVAKQFT